MEVMNCRSCGRLFNFLSGVQVCPNCKIASEEKYEKVKQFIFDNPGTTMQEASKETGVSRRQIEIWVREERLAFSTAEGSEIGCERCGIPIATGKFCRKCRQNLADTLGSFYQPKTLDDYDGPSGSARGKMRFLE